MELIPKEIKEQIPPLYATENEKDPTVYLKFFIDGWSWYVTELSTIDNDTAFGYVVSPFCSGELGYFSINELKSIRGSLCNNVDRDLHFKPLPLSTIKKHLI